MEDIKETVTPEVTEQTESTGSVETPNYITVEDLDNALKSMDKNLEAKIASYFNNSSKPETPEETDETPEESILW